MINGNLHLIHGFNELWSLIRVGLSDFLGADELLDGSDHSVLCHSRRWVSTYQSSIAISCDQHLLLQNQHIIMDFGRVNGIKGDKIAELLDFLGVTVEAFATFVTSTFIC